MRYGNYLLAITFGGVLAGAGSCGDDTSSADGATTGGATPGTGGTAGEANGANGNGGSGASANGGAGASTAGGSGGAAGGAGNAGGIGPTGGAGGSPVGGAGGVGGVATGGTGGTPILDSDQDGWTIADGDCCDVDNSPLCDEPAKVNPGAFEFLGNDIDDDCDPATSDTMAPLDCSPAPLTLPTNSLALMKAMDLCQLTSESPPLPQKKWGVIASDLTLADGTGLPDNVQVGVLGAFGTFVTPKKGFTIAALSSGTARGESHPGYIHPQNGPMPSQQGNYEAQTMVGAPSDYVAAHGGTLPNPPTCPACAGPGCTDAHDSVRFRLRIRVPTNAQSFSYQLKFYTAEYPEYVCEQYNDFFLTLLTSSWVPDPLANPPQEPLPADKNIAIDGLGNPVSVNNAFLDVCFPYFGAPAGTCPGGTLDLVGNGMGGWNGNVTDGAGTVWLTNEAPVVPGETIELEFIVWDAGDGNVDSLALLDKFKWQIDPASVGLHE